MLLDVAGWSETTVLTLPGDGRVQLGSSVVLQCRQTTSAETRGTSSIVWYRQSGDVQHQLGVEDFLVAEFGTVGRVEITRDMLPDSVVSNLTISGKFRRITVMSVKVKVKVYYSAITITLLSRRIQRCFTTSEVAADRLS